MKIERTFRDYFKYSMHDARILKIEYLGDNLILYFDYLFSYNDGNESTHKAKVIFEKVDIDEVDFWIFNDTMKREFSGTYIGLEEYQNKYKYSKFEVLVETYNWSRAVLQGLLWTKNKPVECMLNIFYSGKMIYEIQE